MKNIILIVLLAFSMYATGQITLEFDFDSASTVCHSDICRADQLMIIHFELSGDRYVNINRDGNYISIFDMNHSLLKKIDCSGLPTPSSYGIMSNVIYISDNLFNLDSKIEFLYGFVDASGSSDKYFTGIYNEDGDLLFSDTLGVPIINSNIPQQQFPIYNTSQGTKMILSYPNGHAKVFSLPGTLSTGIAQANGQLMQTQNGQLKNLYPNPSNGTVTLQYQLPEGEEMGELVLYNLQGTEVKRYKVDNTFKDLLLDNSQLQSGTYFYQLQTGKGAVGTKKMIVVK